MLGLEAFGVRFTISVFDPALLERVWALVPHGTVPVAEPWEHDRPLGAKEHDRPLDASDDASADASVDASGDASGDVSGDASGDESRATDFALVAGDGVYRVLLGEGEMLSSRDLDLALFMLGELVHDLVAYNATVGVFVKGAAVLVDGRGVLILGPALSGRSTLLDELVRAGASYWSDRYVVLDRDGRLMRFGEPQAGADGVPGAGPREAHGAPEVGLVVLTQYRPDAVWEPERGTAAEAMLALLEQAVPTRDRAAETMGVVRRATEGAVFVQGERGEAAQVAGLLLRFAENPVGTPGEVG